MEMVCERRGEIDIVKVEGKLDFSQSTGFDDKVRELFASNNTRFLIFDFSMVTALSSPSLRTILASAKRVRKAKGALMVANSSEIALNCLHISGFLKSNMLTVCETLNGAIDEMEAVATASGKAVGPREAAKVAVEADVDVAEENPAEDAGKTNEARQTTNPLLGASAGAVKSSGQSAAASSNPLLGGASPRTDEAAGADSSSKKNDEADKSATKQESAHGVEAKRSEAADEAPANSNPLLGGSSDKPRANTNPLLGGSSDTPRANTNPLLGGSSDKPRANSNPLLGGSSDKPKANSNPLLGGSSDKPKANSKPLPGESSAAAVESAKAPSPSPASRVPKEPSTADVAAAAQAKSEPEGAGGSTSEGGGRSGLFGQIFAGIAYWGKQVKAGLGYWTGRFRR